MEKIEKRNFRLKVHLVSPHERRKVDVICGHKSWYKPPKCEGRSREQRSRMVRIGCVDLMHNIVLVKKSQNTRKC